MTWRRNLLLAALGLALALFVSRFQPFPGYLDSDYYHGGGIQIAQGHGFTEPYLWNYLDNPEALPHPSHSYWMPLASIIAAVGMWATGNTGFAAGRSGFLLLAALVPVLTARLAWSFSRRSDAAMISGLLAVFSIYYAPFLTVPDNYATYIVLGSLFLLIAGGSGLAPFLGMGLIAGTMMLARSDGLLWLGLAAVTAWLRRDPPASSQEEASGGRGTYQRLGTVGARCGLAALGFLIVMTPWFMRNLSVHGTLVAPGGERLLWLTNYNETFAYPPDQLTATRWLDQGWSAIIGARLTALRWNLLNAVAAQGGLFLAPFILLGAWIHRRDLRVRIGILAWLGILAAMSLVFPFAGARGGFFHAGASVQGLWWTLAPLGLVAAVDAARKRGMFTPAASKVFGGALVGLAVLMTAVILWLRVFPGWGEGEHEYPKVEAFLIEQGALEGDVVMVRNPPGYYILTGRSAVVTPYSEPPEILEAARRFHAAYLILEPLGAAGPIKAVYDGLGGQQFELIGDLDGIRIYRIGP